MNSVTHRLPVGGGALVRGDARVLQAWARRERPLRVRGLRAYYAQDDSAITSVPGDQCPLCATGRPCPVWDVDALERERFSPAVPGPVCWTWAEAMAPSPEDRAREAAGVLGVPWPCDAEAVETAFRAALQRTHPDHGPASETAERATATQRVLAAREALWAAGVRRDWVAAGRRVP